MDTLTILFLWHMHQPYYKNLYTEEYLLPWVLLHGTKDYLDMPLISTKFDKIRVNFNLVPSLVVQLLEYARGEAKDLYLKIFRKPANSLEKDEKIFILKNFFNCNLDNMIRPNPRYFELLKKRGFFYVDDEIAKIVDKFTEDDFRDIQILFFLSWIDSLFFEEIEQLKDLKEKGRFFSEDEKKIVENAQKKIIERIIPTYKSLHEAKKIEVTTSPFYHPIIPLLLDTDVAKESMPHVILPKKRFSHPEDAKAQIIKAKELFFEIFGSYPSGMWPPEGSVSDSALRLYIEEGIGWLATDEEILFRTLNFPIKRTPHGREIYTEILYKPYAYEYGGKRVILLFRDKVLSDLISFHYSTLDAKEAVSDFIRRLKEIRKCVGKKIKNPCVLIAMDGENAWEFYKDDGKEFLLYLYEAISKEDFLVSTTISSYLESVSDYPLIAHIFPGSWINHDFKVWIGHEEDNQAWYLLSRTRDFLESKDPERKNGKAWESIYIAEGSDWNWWYGDDHSSENDEIFDLLFRENLANVYRFLNTEPPDDLSIPILLEEREIKPKYEPTSFISPIIDGRITNYFEWLGSGYFESKVAGAAMHESFFILKSLHFGFNRDFMFLRFDVEREILEKEREIKFEINLLGLKKARVIYDVNSEKVDAPFDAKAKFDVILEVQIPRDFFSEERAIFLWSTIRVKGRVCDRIPKKGYLKLTIPDEKFEARMWYV